jgi:hypothetical protein
MSETGISSASEIFGHLHFSLISGLNLSLGTYPYSTLRIPKRDSRRAICSLLHVVVPGN